MILSNIEIQKALEEGRLVIAPEPLPRRPEKGAYCPCDTHAVALRLYQEVTVPQARFPRNIAYADELDRECS